MIKRYKKSDLNIIEENYEFFKNILIYPNEQYVEAKINEESKEDIEIEYIIPDNHQTLDNIKKNIYQERLILFLNLIEILRNNHEFLESKLSENNIIYTPDFKPYVIERKLRVNPPLDAEDFLILAKKNLVYLFSTQSYNRVMNMDEKLWKENEIISDIIDSDNLEEFIGEIEKKIISLNEDLDNNKVIIENTKYKKLIDFKKTTIVIGVILISAILFLGFYKVPLYKKEIMVVNDYEKQSYSEVINDIKKVNPKRLDNTIKYYAAVSAINLEPLTDIQKENLLANLTPNVSSWELDYWVYIGLGNYDEAYNRAIDLKSLDLQEYAVLKKLDMLDVNTKISGEEKQEKRKEYENEIESIEKQRQELEESEQ